MTDNHDPQNPPPEASKPRKAPRIIDAQELFQGAREVWLVMEGVRYRLRITRRNNLALDK